MSAAGRGRFRWIAAWAALPQALIIGGLPAAGQRFDFDSAPTGLLPPNWREVNSDARFGNNWAVLPHLRATTGSQILAKTAMLADRSPVPMAIQLGQPFRDGTVKVQIKPMGGLGPEEAGLVFRFRDESNYYFMTADLSTGFVSVTRVKDGKMAPIAGAGAFKPNPIGWTLCEVSFDEERVLVLINGKPCLEVMDASGGWAGHAGLWAAPGAFTGFDDFEIGRAVPSAPKTPERRSLRR